MAKNLLLYDKYNKVINTTMDVQGTTGYITIENLIPDTDYPEGEFYVGWEVEGKILPKATVPEFTTLRQMREKLVIVYFSDLTEQQLVDIKGDSAYKVALDNGFRGTQQDWLESLKGEPGKQGEQGEPGRDGVDITEGGSAYEISLAEGFQGTREEWLESLKGEPGEPGRQGEKGDPGEDGFGVDGASAYEIALENGFVGNIQDFLDSLVGEPGRDGQDGNDGLSAYQIAKEYGYKGTEQEWLESLKIDKNELINARGDYDNLNQRLNDSDDKLNNTQRVINIVARGAIGDGTTDNYQIIQDAITEAEIDGSSVFIPSGTFYISKNLETKHMTSYNYRFGIKIYGNGKDSIITRKAGKIPADYTSKENLPHQAALSLYGSNNIIEDISINDSQVGIYIGQDPSTTEPSSASMNRMKNIWMEYVGTGLQFTHGAGNHYNIFDNFHIIHAQICVDLGGGYFINKVNNNRNVFNNFRVARAWIGFLLRETDGNFFNNIYAETFMGDGAIGDAPSFLPSELNGKKTFIVALDGQYNTFNNYAAEAVEWYIYSVGFRNSFVNGMTKDDTVETNKVMFPNPARQPLNYMANSTMIAGLVYQPQAGLFFEGSNGIGIQAPYRIFDINYHRQNKSLTQLSSNITGLTSLSSSKAHRVGRKVDWSIYARFIAKFDGNSNQLVKEPIKIKLPFTETPETLYTNALTSNLTKPFMVFVGNSNGATEVAQARISTVAEATEYGGYHLVVNPPATGWRTDANVNFLAFDISWNV